MSLKKLTEEEYFAYIEDNGHVLQRNPDGTIDEFALEFDNHNGPACARAGCHASWCVHCRDKVESCKAAHDRELFPLTPADVIPEKKNV